MVVADINNCMYTPAIPTFARYFNQPLARTQDLVALGLLAYCLSPVFFAAIANKKSRINAIQIGMLFCLLGDVLCFFSSFHHHFLMLVTGIILLNFGGSMGMSLGLTILRDQEDHSLERPISFGLISFAILPGIFIAIGSYLLQKFGWETIFVGLAIYHISLFIFARFLPKRSTKALAKFSPIDAQSMRSRKLIWLAVTAGGFSGLIYSFGALAPHIAMGTLGVSPMKFGLWSNVPSLGMLLGNGLAIYFHRISLRKALLLALGFVAACVLLLAFQTHEGLHNVPLFFIGCSLAFVGIQLAFPFLASRALSLPGDHASHAGFFSVFHFIIASGVVHIANLFPFTAMGNLFAIYASCLVFIVVMEVIRPQ